MGLLRFDPKRQPYFLEVGWPRNKALKKSEVIFRLIAKQDDGKLKLVKNIDKKPFDKESFELGFHYQIPELGDIRIVYKTILLFIPLFEVYLNGEKLRGNEVKSSVLGEISVIG